MTFQMFGTDHLGKGESKDSPEPGVSIKVPAVQIISLARELERILDAALPRPRNLRVVLTHNGIHIEDDHGPFLWKGEQ